ncbi:hypothetical protein M569_01242, partial [Genlisea aurea]
LLLLLVGFLVVHQQSSQVETSTTTEERREVGPCVLENVSDPNESVKRQVRRGSDPIHNR